MEEFLDELFDTMVDLDTVVGVVVLGHSEFGVELANGSRATVKVEELA